MNVSRLFLSLSPMPKASYGTIRTDIDKSWYGTDFALNTKAYRLKETGETYEGWQAHDYTAADNFGALRVGLIARVALQSKLGLCAKRRTGHNSNHYSSSLDVRRDSSLTLFVIANRRSVKPCYIGR
jgi:hypothetical protein